MSDEKKKPALATTIAYVGFSSPVPVGGDLASIEAWSRARHGHVCSLVLEGNWVVMTYKGTTKIRVPMTNVSSIREGGE